MAEYNSLFIKITISEEKLQEFFHERPMAQAIDENWSTWWDSRQMYGKQSLVSIPHYQVQTNRAVFDQLLEGGDFGSVEYYDKNEKSWTFVSVFFSENYTEILPMLSLLKNLATYQRAANKGVAFIYDFCWGGHEVMAYLEFTDQQALLHTCSLSTEIEYNTLQEANRTLEAVIEKFNQQFGDEKL